MSDPGDYGGEMGPIKNLTDREIDTLLSGQMPDGDEELAELAALVDGVRVSCIQSLDPEMERLHVTRIVRAARTPASEPPAAPAERTSVRKPRWVKIAAAAGALVVATGGLAAADVLPAPAQDAVASVANRVGFSLPTSEDDDEGTASPDESSERTGTPEATEPGKSVADDVHDAIDNSDPGPGRGDGVSDAASQNRRGPKESPQATDEPTSTPDDGGEDNSGPSENSGPSSDSGHGGGSSEDNSGPSGSDD